MTAASSRYDTRLSLLRRISAREEDGWLEFYQKYSPLVRWLCRRKGLPGEEEMRLVVQAVMIHFAKLDWKYDPERGQFRNFILKVAELKIHEVRREGARPPAAGEAPEELPDEADPLAAAGRQELLERALLLLCDDPEVDPQQLWIFDQLLSGRSYEDLAGKTGLTPGNLRVIKHRVLLRVRRLVEREGLR
ncbi:MAG: polymerase sigma factor RpoE [Verrucomicrobiota bacterium]|jgi:RNA polymerase sigma factor (sigma-70 family)